MNYIFWNVRGVGNNVKKIMAREIVMAHQSKIACLIETKIREMTLR